MPLDPTNVPSIETIEHYLELVLKDGSDKTVPLAQRKRLVDIDPLSKKRFYYRGESDALKSSALVPNLVRPDRRSLFATYGLEFASDAPDLLERLIHRFVRYAESYRPYASVPADDVIAWMCLGQHHGLPTLLLDWSLNALVALYMACIDYPRKFLSGELAMAIQSVYPRLWNELVSDLAASPLPEQDDKIGVVYQMTLRPSNERRHLTVYMDREYMQHSHYQPEVWDSRGNPRLNPGKIIAEKLDFNSPMIIVPRVFTRRIDAQAGRFVYSKRPTSILDIDTINGETPWTSILPIAKISPEYKQRILRELRMIFIHEGTMFVDLDGYAGHLRNSGL